MQTIPPLHTMDLVDALDREQTVYRQRVLTTVAVLLSGFPLMALAFGGETATPRVLLPLILAEIPIATSIVMARAGRIGLGFACMAAVIVVVAFDVHVNLKISLTAPVFLALIVALGVVLLERSAAIALLAAMIGAIVVMRVERFFGGEPLLAWVPVTIDALTITMAIGVLGLVDRDRVDRNQTRLRAALRDLDRGRFALQEAKQRAESHARIAEREAEIRSMFLARASHELRTPLTAILGYAEMLAEEDSLSEDCRDDIGRIEVAAQRQLQLVDDLLALTDLQVGPIEIRAEEIDLTRLAAPVVERFALATRHHHSQLLVCAESARVRVDVGHVRQILLRLVSNAIRFTEGGTIRVSLRTIGGGALEIGVSDTGVGIAPERIPLLFQPFAQGEACSADRRQGTGLGLAVVAALVGALGGRWEVHSELGKGSLFQVTLPVALAEEIRAQA